MSKIAAWNVNSVNARLERLLAFLKRNEPDIVLLQEIKCVHEKFPHEAVTALGYHASILGQKSYSGVAILSKEMPSAVICGFDRADQRDSSDSRLIGAKFGNLTCYSVYAPNGQEVGSEKYKYKLEWYKQLEEFLKTHHAPTDLVLLGGDFNVARDDRDVWDPKVWQGHIMCSKDERQALNGVLSFGLDDSFRRFQEEGGHFSWWDYRHLSFPLGRGLRIDYVFTSQALAGKLKGSWIERDERKGDKPSDHAPVFLEIETLS